MDYRHRQPTAGNWSTYRFIRKRGEVYPLGIAEGADGNVYVADNQTFGSHTAHKSRLLRVVMKKGKAVRVETVATGFIASNAVEAFGNRIYVTEDLFGERCQTTRVRGLHV